MYNGTGTEKMGRESEGHFFNFCLFLSFCIIVNREGKSTDQVADCYFPFSLFFFCILVLNTSNCVPASLLTRRHFIRVPLGHFHSINEFTARETESKVRAGLYSKRTGRVVERGSWRWENQLRCRFQNYLR
jgi:hypothetical protein